MGWLAGASSVISSIFDIYDELSSPRSSIHPSPSANKQRSKGGSLSVQRWAMADQMHSEAYLVLYVSNADDDGPSSPSIVKSTNGDLQPFLVMPI